MCSLCTQILQPILQRTVFWEHSTTIQDFWPRWDVEKMEQREYTWNQCDICALTAHLSLCIKEAPPEACDQVCYGPFLGWTLCNWKPACVFHYSTSCKSSDPIATNIAMQNQSCKALLHCSLLLRDTIVRDLISTSIIYWKTQKARQLKLA